MGQFHWGKGPQKLLGIFFDLHLKLWEVLTKLQLSIKKFLQNHSVKKNVSPSLKVTREKKTVEALARQFQVQIERILTEKVSPFTWTWLICSLQGQVEKSYLPTRKLHREKSFDEARTAVQSQVHWKQTNKLKTQTNKCSQIERMFLKAAAYLLGCRMSWRPGAHHNRCTTRKCHQELFEATICISSKISVSSFKMLKWK